MANFVRKNLLQIFLLATVFLSLSTDKVNAFYLDMDRDFNSNNSFSLLSEVSQVGNIFSFRTARASSVLSAVKNVTHALPKEVAVVSAPQIFVFDNMGEARLSSNKITFVDGGVNGLITKVSNKINEIASSINTAHNNKNTFTLGVIPRQISLVGNNLAIFSYKGFSISNFALHSFSAEKFSLAGMSYSQFANAESGIASKIPRIAEAKILPVYAVASDINNNSNGMVLGAFTSANAVAANTTTTGKKNLPFLDQLSLSLFCGLSSLSTPIDGGRCNYNSLATGIFSQKTAVNSPVETNKIVDANISNTANTNNTSNIPAPRTPTFAGSNATKYVTQYVTKYVTVAGKNGADGKNGSDGKNGKDAVTPALTGGFGGYVGPSTFVQNSNPFASQSLIGVSTIGYLKDTTIEYANMSYGTSTNMYLANATLSNAIFNGSSIFNGSASFSGSVNVNDLTATSSTFTNSTTTNAYIKNLSVENYHATGDFTISGTTTLATTTITKATINNLVTNNATGTYGFFTNLSATNATIENLVVGTSTTVTLNNLTGTSSSFITASSTNLIAASGTISNLITTNSTSTNFFSTNSSTTNSTSTNLYATNATFGNATSSNGFFTNLVATLANFTDLIISNSTTTNAVTTNATTTNFFATLANIAGLTVTNSTTTNAVITNASTTNLSATGATFTNTNTTGTATINNASTTNISGTGLNFTNGFFSNLVATVANLTGLTAVNSTTTNATSTNFFSTNGTINNFFSTLATIAGLTVTNSTTTNAVITNANITTASTTNLSAVNASTTNLSATGATFTNTNTTGTATINNASTTNLSATGATITNATIGNASTTNVSGTGLSFVSGFFSNLVATIANFTGLTAVNSTTTNATSTNLFSTNGTINNFFATLANIAGLIVTNSTTTNAVITNASTTNLSATGATFTNTNTTGTATINNASTTNLSATGATINNLSTANSTSTNFASTNSSTTNSTSTNIYATNGTIVNATSTNGFFSNLVATLANFTNLIVGNSTTTNGVTTNATSTNFFSTNGTVNNFFSTLANIVGLTVTNSTTTNAVITNANITTASTTNLTAVNSTSTNFVATNATTTNFASTNSSTTNAVIANASTTNLSATGATFTNTNTTGTATINNASTTNISGTNATFTNAYIQNLTVGSSTSMSVSSLTGSSSMFTNATATNFFATNTVMVNATSTNFFANLINGVSAFFTNLTATNASTTNLSSTGFTGLNGIFTGNFNVLGQTTLGNASTTNISGTGLNFTNGFISNATLTNASTTNLSATGATLTNLFSSNALFTNATSTNFFSTNASTTNATSTNLFTTNLTATNASTTNLSANGATLSNLFSSNATLTNASTTNLSANGLFSTNAFVTNFTATNASTTNLSANGFSGVNGSFTGTLNVNGLTTLANASTTNLSANGFFSTNAFVTGFTAVNASTTNLSATGATLANLFSTNATLTNAIITNASTTNLSAVGATFTNTNVTGTETVANASTTNLSAVGATLSSLFSSNATLTNATATNLYATNFNAGNFTAGTSTFLNASTTNLSVSNNLYTSLTAGSIPFVGTGGLLSQNNSSLFWDSANGRLGIGTTTPMAKVGIVGDIAIAGSIIPSTNNLYNLGSTTSMWHSVYIGPGSLYVNNQKVLQTDLSNSVVVSADVNQDLISKTSGTGNIQLNPSGTGLIMLKGNILLSGGMTFRTTDSTPVLFSDGVAAGNINISGNAIQATNLNGGISITPNGNGGTYITNGNFGIGTTSPLAKLAVNGDSYFAGNIYATGTLSILGNTTLGNVTLVNASTTNISGTGLTFTNGYFTNLNVANATLTNASTTNLSATGATFVNTNTTGTATINNASTTNLSATGISSTNGFFANLTATLVNIANLIIGNSTTTNAVITNASTTNLTAVNATSTNFVSTNSTTTNLVATNSTSTNFASTNSSTTNSTIANAVINNASTTNTSANGFYANNAYIQNLTVGTTSTIAVTTLSATSSTFVNATATNFFATNTVMVNATSTNFFANLINGVSAFFTNLTATNASTTNLSAVGATLSSLFSSNATLTNASTTNLSASGLFSTNAFITGLTATNASTTNLSAVGATFGSTNTTGTATIANASTTNLSATGATITSATIGNASTTNLSATGATFTNTNTTGTATINNASTTNISGTGLTFTNGFFSNLVATIANFTGLTATNSTTTNATSTNFFSTNGTLTNAILTNASTTNLSANGFFSTNAFVTGFTATNASTTNLSATGATFTNTNTTGTATILNASTTNLSANGATITNSTLTNATATNFFATTASTTNLTATNGNIASAVLGTTTIASAVINHSTTTNAYIENLTVGSSTTMVITTLTGSSSSFISASSTNLYATNAVFQNATSTNFFSSIVNAITSTINNLTAGNITATGTLNVSGLTTLGNASTTAISGSGLNFTSGFFTNLTAINASTTNLSAVGATLSSLFSSNATITNASTTNLSATGATLTNAFIGGLTSTNGIFTNSTSTLFAAVTASTTNLTALNATLSNATITNASTTNLSATGANLTSLFSANLTATNASTTNLSSNGFTGVNGIFTGTLNVNGFTTLASASTTNLSASGFFSTNAFVTGFTAVNASTTNLSATGATLSSLFSTNATLSNATIANASTTNLSATGFSGTNGIFTGTFNVNGQTVLGNASTTNITVSNALYSLSQISTNETVTNSSTTNLSAVGATFTNSNTTGTAIINNASTTNLSAVGATLSSLFSTNATLTSATATNFFTTNFSATNSTFGTVTVSTSSIGNASSTNLTVASTTYFANNTGIWNASGNVGIGTTVPLSKLDVDGTGYGGISVSTSGSLQRLTLGYAAGQTQNATQAQIWSDSVGTLGLSSRTNYASGISFFTTPTATPTASIQRMIINSEGNVGIGTTAPIRLLSNSATTVGDAISGLTTATNAIDWSVATQGYAGAFRNTGASGNYNSGLLVQTTGTDTTTKILQLESGGTAKVTVLGNGNIGIGTTSPSSLLQINDGSNNTTSQLAFSYTNAGVTSNTHTMGRSSSTGLFEFNALTNSNGYLFKSTAASPGTFVVNSMNVGIGNTSPVKMLELGASAGAHGYIRLNGPTINEGNIYHDATYGIHMDTNGNSLPIKIDGSALILGMTGNVGIGTTTPVAPLTLQGGSVWNSAATTMVVNGTYSAGAGGYPGITFASNGTAQGLIRGEPANGGLDIFGGSGYALGLSINSSGNVGIGTSTPDDMFEVRSNNATIATAGFYNAAGTNTFKVLDNGNVGIGTVAPNSKLHLGGGAAGDASSIRITTTGTGVTSTDGSQIGIDGYDSSLGLTIWNYENAGIRFGTNNLARVTIQNDGSVGIGTTSPLTNLSVVGSGYFTGGLGIGTLNTTPGTLKTSGNATVGSNLLISTILNCNSSSNTLQTDGSGQVVCATVTTIGGTSAGGWTYQSPNIVRLATTTDIVGMGVVNPSAKLDINSGSAGTTTLALHAVTSQTANILEAYDNSLTLNTVITSLGRLGLGVTAPTDKLQVAGNITPSADGVYGLGSSTLRFLNTFTQNIFATSSVITNATSTNIFSTNGIITNLTNNVLTTNSLTVTNASTTNLSVASTTYFANNTGIWDALGNLGIGTTTPQALVHAYKNGNSGLELLFENDFAGSGASAQFSVKTDSGKGLFKQYSNEFASPSYLTSSTYIGAPNSLILQTDDAVATGGNGKILFFTGGYNANQERMRIDQNGNVGIGSTTPSAKLGITGTGATTGLTFQTTDSSNNETFFIKDGGSVGVRYYPFTIGMSSAQTPITGARLQVVGTSVTTLIDSAGNLGIGTTTPSNALTVMGATGNMFTDGLRVVRDGTPSQYTTLNFAGGAANLTSVNTAGTGAWTYFNRSNNGTSALTSMTIDTNGNVGIGTTTPTYTLDIQPTPSAANAHGAVPLRITGQFGAASDDVQMRFAGQKDGDLWAIGSDIATGGSTGDFEFYNMGNAGGTTGTKMTILGNGNVGIGTSTPLFSLDVMSNQRIYNATDPYLLLARGSNLAYLENYNGQLHVQAQAMPIYFETDNSYTVPKMMIATSGNVGLGTTNPGAKLDVLGIANNYAGNFVANSTTGQSFGVNISGGTNASDIALNVNNAALTSLFRIRGDGNVGIGTTAPLQKLQVDAGNLYFSGASPAFNTADPRLQIGSYRAGDTGAGHFAFGDGTGYKLYFGKASDDMATKFMTIQDNGNVGIGTTSPAFKLDVNGIINATALYVNGTPYIGSQWTTSGSDISYNTGRVAVGTTTFSTLANISMESTTNANGSTYAIGGIFGNYNFNPSAGGVQVGNRFVVNNAPTSNANTSVNQIVRTVDNTSLANTVRGIEVVSNAGSNTAGVNTGIRSTGATFGVQAFSSGLAGGVSTPAALYAESTGTTNGDVMRLYTSTMTSASNMANIYQEISTYTGTALGMNMGLGGGAFTGNFMNLQNGGVSKFIIDSTGKTGIGTSTLAAVQLTVAGDIRVGNSGTNGCVQGFGGATLIGTCTSDQRLKTNIVEVGSTNSMSMLTRLQGLRVINFNWNDTANSVYGDATSTLQTGYLAQNVESIFPELVSTSTEGFKQVNYTALGLYAIEGVKQLSIASTQASSTLFSLSGKVDIASSSIMTLSSGLTQASSSIITLAGELSTTFNQASSSIASLSNLVSFNQAQASTTIASLLNTVTNNQIAEASSTANIISLMNANVATFGSQIAGITSKINLANGKLNTMTFTSNGNVGIGNDGTSIGGELLRVSGNIRAQGFVVDSAADIAESFPASEAVDAGTVVAFGTSTVAWDVEKGEVGSGQLVVGSNTNATTTNATSTNATSTVSASSTVSSNVSSLIYPAKAATSNVYHMSTVRKAVNGYEAVGVISTRAGVLLGGTMTNGVPVTFSGRIPVKVTTENGIVKQGDYLTVSKTMPGYAMKLTEEGRAIGRALSDYEAGRDRVLMLVENGNQKLDFEGKNATTTGMLTVGNLDLNANGVALYNIKSLASANGTWSIDENGRIVGKVLCLEDVCISKTQLSQLLNNAGGMVAGTSTTGGASSGQSVVGSNTTNASTTTSSTTNASTTVSAPTTSTSTAADITPPTISIIGGTPVSAIVGSTYTDQGATAIDNVDGNLTSVIFKTGTVDTATIGSYSIHYSVTDKAGNTATVARVVDVIADPAATSAPAASTSSTTTTTTTTTTATTTP